MRPFILADRDVVRQRHGDVAGSRLQGAVEEADVDRRFLHVHVVVYLLRIVLACLGKFIWYAIFA